MTRQKGQIQKSGLHGWNFTLGLDFLKTRRKNFDMWAPWRIAFFERFVPFKCNLHQISLAITQDCRSCIEFISVNCVKTREKRSSLKFEAETTSYIVLPFSLMRSHKIGTKNSAHENAEDQMFDFLKCLNCQQQIKLCVETGLEMRLTQIPRWSRCPHGGVRSPTNWACNEVCIFIPSLFLIFELWKYTFIIMKFCVL